MNACRTAYVSTARHVYYGGGYGWRFSATRSVQCATSDREMNGGMTTRCLPLSRS